MSTEAQIMMNFQMAVRKAEELEQVSSELKALVNNDMETSMQSLSNAWKGEAATAYLNKGVKLQEKIIASAKQLDKTATTIRNVAKRTYDAEMRALQIARERAYAASRNTSNGGGGGGSF